MYVIKGANICIKMLIYAIDELNDQIIFANDVHFLNKLSVQKKSSEFVHL